MHPVSVHALQLKYSHRTSTAAHCFSRLVSHPDHIEVKLTEVLYSKSEKNLSLSYGVFAVYSFLSYCQFLSAPFLSAIGLEQSISTLAALTEANC